jgi:hypothetical protein
MTFDGETVDFDDRVLTHLHVVVMQKFRRGECLLMSWVDDRAIGGGRSAVWLTPTVPIRFEFGGTRVPPIDRSWLRRLAVAADSAEGLVVADADGALIRGMGLGHRPRASHTSAAAALQSVGG